MFSSWVCERSILEKGLYFSYEPFLSLPSSFANSGTNMDTGLIPLHSRHTPKPRQMKKWKLVLLVVSLYFNPDMVVVRNTMDDEMKVLMEMACLWRVGPDEKITGNKNESNVDRGEPLKIRGESCKKRCYAVGWEGGVWTACFGCCCCCCCCGFILCDWWCSCMGFVFRFRQTQAPLFVQRPTVGWAEKSLPMNRFSDEIDRCASWRINSTTRYFSFCCYCCPTGGVSNGILAKRSGLDMQYHSHSEYLVEGEWKVGGDERHRTHYNSLLNVERDGFYAASSRNWGCVSPEGSWTPTDCCCSWVPSFRSRSRKLAANDGGYDTQNDVAPNRIMGMENVADKMRWRTTIMVKNPRSTSKK